MDGGTILKTSISSNIEANKKDYIRSRLIEFNLRHFPEELKGRYEELKLHLVDEDEDIIGGIVGEFCWNWLEIHYLFVEEEHRKSGYGQLLIREAEKMAIQKKCDFIKLDTLSFQALGFYVKEGYEVYGTIENAGGHTHYYLKKDIKNRA
ncbi:GNAT family acetyltransferase [Paenibacillus oryzae]|uniref:GNAT family acetyltransferase n=1 Tax=Paenibacillus oryzae TaxID=1844972 RepID=A0A1A5YHY9_9BACL|nr:GNAT family acetyltransferase [Paenibacillus oryzae]